MKKRYSIEELVCIRQELQLLILFAKNMIQSHCRDAFSLAKNAFGMGTVRGESGRM